MSKFSYHDLEKLFNRTSLRERYILFVAILICSVAITYFWVLEPSFIEQVKIEKEIKKNQQLQRSLLTEIKQVKDKLKQDPVAEINRKIAFSQGTLKNLNAQLEDKLFKFIQAQEMPLALTKVLAKTPGVTIKGLKSLPVKVFNAAAQNKNKALDSDHVFYQHTLEITLQGDYNAIYRYLLSVESLDEKFYWYSLDYQVTEYPVAEVTIQIYTLSDQQDLVSG